MIQFSSITPMLQTHQLQETIAFYCDVLGFTVSHSIPECNDVILQRGACQLKVSVPNAYQPLDSRDVAGTFCIQVDDVDGLWHQLKNKVQVSYEPETSEWGMRTFAILDTNGNLLQFEQEMTPFL